MKKINDFINEKLKVTKNTNNTKEGTVNTETGELLDEDGVTPISEIIG